MYSGLRTRVCAVCCVWKQTQHLQLKVNSVNELFDILIYNTIVGLHVNYLNEPKQKTKISLKPLVAAFFF